MSATEPFTIEGVLLDAAVAPPGSTLVFRVRPSISLHDFNTAKEQIERLAPGHRVIVAACEQIVVLAPEDKP